MAFQNSKYFTKGDRMIKKNRGDRMVQQLITSAGRIVSVLHHCFLKTSCLKKTEWTEKPVHFLQGALPMLLLKVQTLNWELSSWSQTNTHRCFSAYVTLGKRLSLLWAECSHQTTPPLRRCRHRFRLRQGYHAVSDMLADTSTLLTVVSTSLCCPQDTRCQANDTDRVQQALTPPETNPISRSEWCTAFPECTLWSPSIHWIDRSACLRYQCMTRNKKPRQEIHQSSVTFGLILYLLGKSILYVQWTIIVSLAFFELTPRSAQAATPSVLIQTPL